MNEREWSAAQQQAIAERGRAILVSAGAGSGKTSVLVERVIQRILGRDAVDIDRILIVTFTEAAAAEMRERIASAIRSAMAQRGCDERLGRQLFLLERATISTLHSFCLQVIRSAGLQAPVDPGFRIMDQQEQSLLLEHTLDDVLEQRFAGTDDDFQVFVARYGGTRGEVAIRKLVLDLYAFARSQPDPDRWLTESTQRFVTAGAQSLSSSALGQAFYQALEERFLQNAATSKEALRQTLAPDGPAKWSEVIQRECTMLAAAVQAAKQRDLSAIRRILPTSFERLPTDKSSDADVKKRVKDLRDQMKKDIALLIKGVCGRDEERLLAEMRETAQWVHVLVHLVRDFSRVFEQAKRERGTVDFADLEHVAYGALVAANGDASPLSRQLAARFEEVMVDEYQDTSPIQDALLALVAKEGGSNLFQVGDVKQSIYRFRMAEPGLFLQKYAAYSAYGGGVSIDLTDNFRSRSGIVDAINFLFGQILSPALGGLAYDARARMTAGARFPAAPQDAVTLADPVEIHWLESTGHTPRPDAVDGGEEGESSEENAESGGLDGIDLEEDLTPIEREARVIGQRILELKNGGQVVRRSDPERYEPLAWRDMAILLRSARQRTEPILRVLRQLGIPCHGVADDGFFQGLEMRLATALLQILDNPMQDIPLVAVLRSPIGGFDSADLAQIRTHGAGSFFAALQRSAESPGADSELAQRTSEVMAKLDGWRTQVRNHSVADAIAFLLEDSGLFGFCLSLPGGAERVANLKQLVRLARAYDAMEGEGFAGFVAYLEQHEASGNIGAAGASGGNDDVVRVMTIHKSKGLEFPVVFIANMGGRFQLADTKTLFALHRTLGFGPQYVDWQRRQRYDTVASLGIRQWERREMLAEEARVLYVGLTRAREKLILVGTLANPLEAIAKWQEADSARPAQVGALPDATLLRARSFLDWLGPALYRSSSAGSPLFRVRVWADTEDIGSGQKEPGLAAPDWGQVAILAKDALPRLSAAEEQLRVWWRDELGQTVYRGDTSVPKVPAKLSVTEWKSLMAPSSSTTGLNRRHDDVDAVARRLARPRFVQSTQALTATEKGTLFHRVMQHISLSPELVDPARVKEQLAELCASDHLRAEDLSGLSVSDIVKFFQGPLGQRLLKDPTRVRREVSFTISLPMEAVLRHDPTLRVDDNSAHVMMQGTADCVVFEDHGILLLDYKTDRINGDCKVVAARYAMQVSVYREALSRAFGRPVTEVYLYFVNPGTAISMEASGLTEIG